MDSPVGELWTMESLEAHFNLLEDGALDKSKSDHVRGVTMPALFTSIEIENILVPPLHGNELFVNTPIKALMRWVHERIEVLPQELVDARLEHVDLMLQHEETTKELVEAKAGLKLMKAEGKALKPKKHRTAKEFIWRYAEHEADVKENDDLTEFCSVKVKRLERLSVSEGVAIKAAAKKVSKIEKKKKHGALSQPIRQRIEEMLQSVYQIIRSAYHGGDFEGNHCRKFMRNARGVMDSIQQLLLDTPADDRAADDDEIRHHCAAFKRLFQCFDLLIHHCQQSFGSLTNADMDEVRKLVAMLDRLWRRMFETVPPKAHAWWHLLVDLERLRGLKHHQESKIEVSHQVGRKIDLLFRSINDIEKKIDCSLKQQCSQAKPSMQLIQEEVKKKRARPRKRKAPSPTEEEEEKDRHRGLLELPEIDGDFPSLLDVDVNDRRRSIALEAATTVAPDDE